jgi:putative oxidoreductase
MDIGLLLIRLSIGLVLAPHGLQKLFGWFDGPGLRATEGYFRGLGLRPAKAHAVLAGLCEFGGGMLVALGVLTPLGSAITGGTMLVAIGTVAIHRGFFANKGGVEFPLCLCLGAFAVAFTGPGQYSLDRVLSVQTSGVAWGVGALALAVFAAVGAAMTRWIPPVRRVAPTSPGTGP